MLICDDFLYSTSHKLTYHKFYFFDFLCHNGHSLKAGIFFCNITTVYPAPMTVPGTSKAFGEYFLNEWIWRSYSGFSKLREWEEENFGICIWEAFGAIFGQINLSKLPFPPLENGDNHNICIIRILREWNEVKCLASCVTMVSIQEGMPAWLIL